MATSKKTKKIIPISHKQRLAAIKNVNNVTNEIKRDIVPLVIKKLKTAKGRLRFISAPEIKNHLNKHYGLKIGHGTLRSVLHYIRINGIVKCLIATSQGYYITNNTLEMQAYLKSLRKRMRQIGALAIALDRQGHEKLGKQISTKVIKKKPLKTTKKKHGK